jgi:MFS transporter, Spinster family, sphingosine-1-phosphate transporter
MQRVTYKNYLVILLMLILAFNFVDRLALGLVLQDIKAELRLSDTQLGLLTGIAFALFYSTMGIPIARWADRGNRVTIIALTTAIWSAAVASCGAATSFVQLMLIRVGVAVGEAGCMPPAHSLISDYFTRAERPRAIARYMLGGSLALTIGYFGAGWINELYGWRITFGVLGLPGLILAGLAWLTLKEPRSNRDGASPALSPATGEDVSFASAPPPALAEVCRTLWTNRAFRHLLFAFSVWFLSGYGMLQWQPAFFIRSHGLQTGELGMWFSLVYGVVGALGLYLGGELAARYAVHDERLQLRACAVAFVSLAVIKAYAFLAADPYVALGALAVAAFVSELGQAPMYATIQTLVPPRMRAMAIALVYLFANLIGMGFGPLAAGALSDALRPSFAEESLRYALVALCPGYFWAAWHLWCAGRTVSIELAAGRLGQAHHESRRAVPLDDSCVADRGSTLREIHSERT